MFLYRFLSNNVCNCGFEINITLTTNQKKNILQKNFLRDSYSFFLTYTLNNYRFVKIYI